MTKHFLRELEQLKRDVLVMGGQAESAVARAMRAFMEADDEAAEGVLQGDREVNALELRVEEECLKIPSLYAPAAKDLRFVVGVFKITNDLERVGDLACTIAERAMSSENGEARSDRDALDNMAIRTRGMLNAALDAFLSSDETRARQVLEMDDEIDDLLSQIYRHQAGVVQEDGSLFKPSLRELSVAKALERIADHSTNIAEDVIYMVSGEVVKHQH